MTFDLQATALPVILVALREGCLVIIDELDAKLHPKLLRYVISMFKNRKINKHSSQIYSLYEIRRENNQRVNSTAAFDKQYLEGRYGADPYLQNMLSRGEWI